MLKPPVAFLHIVPISLFPSHIHIKYCLSYCNQIWSLNLTLAWLEDRQTTFSNLVGGREPPSLVRQDTLVRPDFRLPDLGQWIGWIVLRVQWLKNSDIKWNISSARSITILSMSLCTAKPLNGLYENSTCYLKGPAHSKNENLYFLATAQRNWMQPPFRSDLQNNTGPVGSTAPLTFTGIMAQESDQTYWRPCGGPHKRAIF